MSKKNTQTVPQEVSVAQQALELAQANQKALEELRTDLTNKLKSLTDALDNLKNRNHLR